MINKQTFYFLVNGLLLLLIIMTTNVTANSTLPSSKPTERLRAAWDTYYSTIAGLREFIEATDRFNSSPDHRAKAYHSLLEAQAMAYRMALPTRAENPLVHTRMWYGDVATLGGNSPDFFYGAMFLDGQKTYKVRGRFGQQKMIILQGYSHLLGHKESKLLGNFDFSEFELNSDGSFEVIISAEKQKGNWIPLDPNSRLNFFFVRRAVDDWYRDLGELSVVPVNDREQNRYDELSEELQAERILLAADLMTYLVKQWTVGIYDLYLQSNKNKVNQLAVVGGESIAEDRMGSPSTYYIWGVYQLENDEAIIIEYDKPDARYWSFQLFDVWCKSMDFINHQTDVNMNRVKIDDDGKVRYVISLSDPGVANWLDPVGRKEGTMVGRNYLANSKPSTPIITKIKLSKLMQYLPADTATVTSQQRRKIIDYRRTGYLKMTHEID